MKNLKLQGMMYLLLFATIVVGCSEKNSAIPPTDTPVAELEALIKKQVDSLYTVYSRFDYDWIEFYADEYTAIYPDMPIKKMSKDSLRAQWERIYEAYDVTLLDRGVPSIIASEDMAITNNSFNEIFVNKETNDTIKNVGTYIVAWKRQSDNAWKIVYESVYND